MLECFDGGNQAASIYESISHNMSTHKRHFRVNVYLDVKTFILNVKTIFEAVVRKHMLLPSFQFYETVVYLEQNSRKQRIIT